MRVDMLSFGDTGAHHTARGCMCAQRSPAATNIAVWTTLFHIPDAPAAAVPIAATGLVACEELHHLQDMLSNRLYRLMHITAVQLEEHLQQSGSSSSNLQALPLPGQAYALDGSMPPAGAAAAAATIHDHAPGLTPIKEGKPASLAAPSEAAGVVEGQAAGVTGPSLATKSVPLDALRRRLNYTHSLRASSVHLPAHPWAATGAVKPEDVHYPSPGP